MKLHDKSFKAFLRGDKRPRMSQAAYDAWRATIPYTNEELAAAIEDAGRDLSEGGKKFYASMAASVRGGFLTSRYLSAALSTLVKTCFCGKKALYRWALEGRCSEHRHVKAAKLFAERDKRIAFRKADHANAAHTSKFGKRRVR